MRPIIGCLHVLDDMLQRVCHFGTPLGRREGVETFQDRGHDRSLCDNAFPRAPTFDIPQDRRWSTTRVVRCSVSRTTRKSRSNGELNLTKNRRHPFRLHFRGRVGFKTGLHRPRRQSELP